MSKSNGFTLWWGAWVKRGFISCYKNGIIILSLTTHITGTSVAVVRCISLEDMAMGSSEMTCKWHLAEMLGLIWQAPGIWKFNTLMCIDTAVNLVNCAWIDSTTAVHICSKFVQMWFAMYPCPLHCVYDKGGEFIGEASQWLLRILSIKDAQSTCKNLQLNLICECVCSTNSQWKYNSQGNGKDKKWKNQ